MSELSDLYQEVILDHSQKPHNYRVMTDATQSLKGHNPLCGDQMTLYLRMEGDKIQDITFQGQGCAISKSSTSVLTDLVKNKTKAEALALFDKFQKIVTGKNSEQLDDTDLMAVFAGVASYPNRIKCAILAWHTLKSALENKQKQVSTE